MQHTHPHDAVELWTTDQHRLGLKPLLRRMWCRRGQHPLATVQHRYQWCYLYAFVHPHSGRTFWLLLPTLSIAAFTGALAEVAQPRKPSRPNGVSRCRPCPRSSVFTPTFIGGRKPSKFMAIIRI